MYVIYFAIALLTVSGAGARASEDAFGAFVIALWVMAALVAALALADYISRQRRRRRKQD